MASLSAAFLSSRAVDFFTVLTSLSKPFLDSFNSLSSETLSATLLVNITHDLVTRPPIFTDTQSKSLEFPQGTNLWNLRRDLAPGWGVQGPLPEANPEVKWPRYGDGPLSRPMAR